MQKVLRRSDKFKQLNYFFRFYEDEHCLLRSEVIKEVSFRNTHNEFKNKI